MNVFVSRPRMSIVLATFIVIVGVLSLYQLPLTQFPSIAPPEVNVTAEFPGANAETSIKAVVTPLERAINGVPRMKYMSSDAGNDGVSVIQVIFETGTDPDVAAVNVQNRVASVLGELPEEVTKSGIKIAKEENSMLMYLNIFSSDPGVDERFLYNFADLNVLPQMKRINGVGFADIMGAKEYAMRIWINPNRLLAHKLSTQEVIDALNAQNIEAAPGKIGEGSGRSAQTFQYILRYTGKYSSAEQYRNIPLRSLPDGSLLRLGDIAEVEFSTAYFDVISKYNGKPSAAIVVKQLPGSNASKVIAEIKALMEQIKGKVFLQGMDYEISYDVSKFLDASINEVVRTLIEAFLLVALVVFLFLKDFRSTIIPVIVVPVSLVGVFAVMLMAGISVNLITLMGLVLAIGIVVDNAIVVVEAVHVKLEHDGLSIANATDAAMQEISRAIVSITLIMSAVFVPVAFLPGPVGVFYRQFSVTMTTAIVLSGILALTLTPALCGALLRHNSEVYVSTNRFSRWTIAWGAWLDRCLAGYGTLLPKLLRTGTLTWTVTIGAAILSVVLLRALPTGFIPSDDQGVFYVSITAPPGSTLERTEKTVAEVVRTAMTVEGVASVSSLAGTNILSDGTGATYGTCLVNLQPWETRSRTLEEVIEDLRTRLSHVKDAQLELFPPPAVPGYGNASGFEFRLLDKSGGDNVRRMQEVNDRFLRTLREQPEIGSAFSVFDASFPQFLLHVDSDRAAKNGVSVEAAMSTLQALIGGEYATNFIRFGQMYKVMVQALPQHRAVPDDVLRLFVKNNDGEMVPFSAFMRLEKVYGLDQVTRYNMYPSAEINGEPASGYTSGDALAALQRVAAKELPRGFEIAWAGMTLDEVQAGNTVFVVFGICLVFVYLLMVAQYESFVLPFVVLLSLPVGAFGAFGGLWLAGLENNIYAQISVVMLIGLLGKNAVLIVEFAAAEQSKGMNARTAAIRGAVLRARPILMTSFAFIAGLLPLVFASGAGAMGNKTVGTAAASGMLVGTVLGLLTTPGIYALIAPRKRGEAAPQLSGESTKVRSL